MGQFMTPASVSEFMASLFQYCPEEIALLDPGAGVGSLTAAFIQEIMGRKSWPAQILVDAYELEPAMLDYLESTLDECRHVCLEHGVEFSGQVIQEDFINRGVGLLRGTGGLFGGLVRQYTHCIMNPPYKKIRSKSDHRAWLRQIGVETSNLYSGFLAIAIKMLAPGGELVAIVPRSFCNGLYFKPFRRLLLSEMALKHLHVFETRNKAFKDDDVLQENIIFHAVKGAKQGKVVITSSSGPSFDEMTQREVPYSKVVKPKDLDQYIHIAASEFDQMVVDRMSGFTYSLSDLDIDVCTGPVVDFRLRADIRQQTEKGACPLIYPGHFVDNHIAWPKPEGKKPNSIFESEKSSRWLMQNGWYVVTRRFSAKEEPRRIVAAVHDPGRIPGEKVGFENHLNVFHKQKSGLDPLVAKGLAVYLNSTLVDLYFRQFSGHTQVNATDLRMMHFPSLETLVRLGEKVRDDFPEQKDVDAILEAEIDKMVNQNNTMNPLQVQQKIDEALSILSALGLPKGQRNERSALTLLALLGLKPGDAWEDAGNPLMGITPIMDFCRDHYGKAYAPNTRETFRRQTMHQFVDAGIAVPNPDRPDRPVNSPKWVYQIEPDALNLVNAFGSANWEGKLASYLAKRKSLAERYAKERKMQMIPLVVNGNKEIALTPGAHSELIRDIIEQFGPRYAPGSQVLYVGDTGSKMGVFEKEAFEELGLSFDSHGKFPDVVLYDAERDWLLLIESVTSHGPVDAKRHSELSRLFAESTAGLVYVTAFPDRQTMGKYLADISWETEVWTADAPSHLIHFNGERFLGPYTE